MPERLRELKDKRFTELFDEKDFPTTMGVCEYAFETGFNACWNELAPLVEALEQATKLRAWTTIADAGEAHRIATEALKQFRGE